MIRSLTTFSAILTAAHCLANSPVAEQNASATRSIRAQSSPFQLQIEQITSGTKHHFFGYIGQSLTIPWSSDNRYILGLEIEHIERMPKPDEAATVVLVDTHWNNKILRVDETRAWNPQQGTMFYWNPQAAQTQFFFNDRNVTTGQVFTVLYDIEKKPPHQNLWVNSGSGRTPRL